MERPGPLAAHTATDVITQEIREALKAVEDETLVVNEETFNQYRRPGKKKVVIVKEIMGQGAMHDNLILPVEPVGVLGACLLYTSEDDEIMIINKEGIIIRMKCEGISVLGRITSGVKLINLKEGDIVASIAKIRKGDEEEEQNETD